MITHEEAVNAVDKLEELTRFLERYCKEQSYKERNCKKCLFKGLNSKETCTPEELIQNKEIIHKRLEKYQLQLKQEKEEQEKREAQYKPLDKKFIVYVKECGYYAPNTKYADMWNITSEKSAKVMSLGKAMKVKRWLTRGGYEVLLKPKQEPKE